MQKKDTNSEFDSILSICVDIFKKKMEDYGTAWRIMRAESMTDQIFIKAQRIRSIETKGVNKVDEGIRDEFIGIINYSAMALIQLQLGASDTPESNKSEILDLFLQKLNSAKELMNNKNHDYDEAWRKMRISSFTDLILMKLYRTKEIENHKGNTLISEGVDANYMDIINYSIFAMIIIDFYNSNIQE